MSGPIETFNGNLAVPIDGRIGFGLPEIGSDRPTGPVLLASIGDPNGVITAPVSTLALQADTAALWQNTDGGTTWSALGAGQGNVLVSFGGAQQTIANATPTVIDFPVVSDPTGAWDAAGNVWTCPVTGIYEIAAVVTWDNLGTGGSTRNANVQLDALGAGAFVNSLDFDATLAAVMPGTPAAPIPLSLYWRGALNATDLIRIRTRMDGEGAPKTIGDIAILGGTTWLSIVRDYRFA